MNTLKQDKRRSRERKASLEYLDARIVPATIQPSLAAAAEVASVHPASPSPEAVPAVSASEIRHENRIIKLAERREKVAERKELALERREARLSFHAQAVTAQVENSGTVARKSATPTTALSATSASAAAIASSPVTSIIGSTAGSSSPTPVPAPTSPVGGTTSGSTTPLPSNVSALLNTIYEDYESGVAIPVSAPGQVAMQGSNVGVQLQTSNSSDFASMVTAAESLGLQVTTESAAFDIVVGYLPITELPAAAALTGSPVITPLLTPVLN